MSKDVFGKLDASSKEEIKAMEELLKKKTENTPETQRSDSKKVTA